MLKEPALHILLVDDDSTDRELFIEAINCIGAHYYVSQASNGDEALKFLLHTEQLPDIIIMDLNMPVKDGRETLSMLKQQDQLRTIPVCIMSTSNAHFDTSNAYKAGANLFLVKPFDFKELIEMLSCLLTLFEKHVSLVNSTSKK